MGTSGSMERWGFGSGMLALALASGCAASPAAALPATAPAPAGLVATPYGPVAVGALAAGDPVWSLDADGYAVVVPVVRVRSWTEEGLAVVTLSDGRTVEGWETRPTGDGRTFGELQAGDALDGARVERIRWVVRPGAQVFDLRPAGDTGAWWSDGVLVGTGLGEDADGC